MLLAALLLAACAPSQPGDDAEVDAATEVGGDLEIVSPVFPLASLAETIAPDADVQLLGARGADPHDLELSPGERALIEQADLGLHLGDLDFQPQVEAAFAERELPTVDVVEVVGTDRLLHWDHDHGHDDDHDHGHEDDHHDDDHDHGHDDHAHEDDHDHGEHDPHVWFDPALMAEVAEAIGEQVAELVEDPDEAEAARELAADVAGELRDVDRRADELLAAEACGHDRAIVSHEAYAYLLEPRGLVQEGISDAGGHAPASPQRLAELTGAIEREGVPAVLAEPVEGREDAEALAAEAGVEMLEIHPLEIVTDDERERGYVALLDEQVDVFARALGCEGAR